MIAALLRFLFPQDGPSAFEAQQKRKLAEREYPWYHWFLADL
jgi:hypothetical protein